ncbi:glycosyltransferase [Pseudaminobacter sp. NGMCC 1.201702]|uniref:glycosyltransferase n=1 Tax=Pseudaminobacter sp. NGMCC 1.201702 TaxID=3391825 RepID=UPI0039EECAED
MNMRFDATQRRILFVIGSLHLGGAESQLTMLAAGLQERGWQVIVFALDASGPLRAVLEENACMVVDGGYASTEGGKVAKLVSLASAQARLMHTAVRERIDVIHGFLPLTNFMAALAGWMTRRRVIITSRRGLGTHQDRHPHLRVLDRIANRFSHVVTANSKAVADDVAHRDTYPRDRIVIIGNGLDFPRVTAAANTRQRVRRELGLGDSHIGIIKVANLIPYKGHDDLIAAFAALAVHDCRLRLFLVGEDRGLLDSLVAQTEQLNIQERVMFLGRRQDVPALLAGMDIGVMASHEEGFSNALLEKLAIGLPVVATDVGGNREALSDMPNCLIIPARNPRRLEDGLRALIERLPEGELLAIRRANQIRERYSIESMVVAYEALYFGEIRGIDNCLDNHPTGASR